MPSTFDAEPWVAIVDDDELIRRALERLLRAHGINARSFHSACDYLRRAPSVPVCICLDVYLREEMTGLDLAEQLRARGSSAPIIFMTGQDWSELGPAMGSVHPDVVLRKPVDSKLLLELITQHARASDGRGAA